MNKEARMLHWGTPIWNIGLLKSKETTKMEIINITFNKAVFTYTIGSLMFSWNRNIFPPWVRTRVQGCSWFCTLVCTWILGVWPVVHLQNVSTPLCKSAMVHTSTVTQSIKRWLDQQCTKWSKLSTSVVFLQQATESRIQPYSAPPSQSVSRCYRLAKGTPDPAVKCSGCSAWNHGDCSQWRSGRCDKVTCVWAPFAGSTCHVWSDNGGRSSLGKSFPPPYLPEGPYSTEEMRSSAFVQPLLDNFV